MSVLVSRHHRDMTHHINHPLTPAAASRARVLWRLMCLDERGSATAEYAIATMAAVGFAGLLVVILRGDEVKAILTDMVHRALTGG